MFNCCYSNKQFDSTRQNLNNLRIITVIAVQCIRTFDIFATYRLTALKARKIVFPDGNLDLQVSSSSAASLFTVQFEDANGVPSLSLTDSSTSAKIGRTIIEFQYEVISQEPVVANVGVAFVDGNPTIQATITSQIAGTVTVSIDPTTCPQDIDCSATFDTRFYAGMLTKHRMPAWSCNVMCRSQ